MVVLAFWTRGAGQPIHLRNETFDPAHLPPAPVAAASTAQGLFLLQFTGSPRPEWRAQLETRGVRFLRYVPENTFVIRLDNAPLDSLRQLAFVRWVGDYRPDYKLHRQLEATKTPASPAVVSVLLAADATETAAVEARGHFFRAPQETRLRAGRVLRGEVDPVRLKSLTQSEAVLWIEPSRPMKLYDEVASRIVAGDGPPGQTRMQSLGYTGAGVTVAVADSGLDSGNTNFMHPDIQGRVRALFHYGASLADAADEHSHGTHCAGIIAGNGAVGETDETGMLYGLGVAPGASLIGQRTFDGNGNYTLTDSFETLTRDAKRAGADIGSNSWGDDIQGRYDLSAMQFDELVRDADALALGDQPYILEFSAGNAGPNYRTIGSPAVAKNVIATGASQNERFNLPIEEFAIYAEGRDAIADFSSRGPCEDGRVKPDLVAPGSWIASLRSVYANDGNAWWPISENYLYQGGTSQAGPHVAGAAAVFVQYYRDQYGGATPSPALVKAALINSAADLDDSAGTAPVPNNDEGWGCVNLPALIGSARDYHFIDQTILLTNGAVFEQRVLIGRAEEPLKVTLTYTDVPGLPAAVIALVNDLDLEVIAPTGEIFRGNQFADGESLPNATGTDRINNVEAVHLAMPVVGAYRIRVRGARVVEDARRDTGAVDQDFALVISGAFGAPGEGMITFDRAAYRAPDQIQITLVDYDLAGQPSANVWVRSDTEPTGEFISLAARDLTGVFTGAVATATGPAVADGTLQIAHGDQIEVEYADASPQAQRVFTARADLQPPVIAGVQATNQWGQLQVRWTTDEPARSWIYYGTPTPNQSLTNLAFDEVHEFGLLNVPSGAAIHFLVVAEDIAGNRATNDNAGAWFTVTNASPSVVLLVDSYADGGFISPPPLDGYTDALDALGVAYDVFDATDGDEPTAAQLQLHRCVIWRMDELFAPPVTLVDKLAAYVTGGGSLLIASMEGVTRLTEAGRADFNTDILQIQSYTEDQPVDGIAGAPGEPIGSGILLSLDYSPYDELLALLTWFGVTDPSDWIVPTTNASPILLSDDAIVGVRSPRTGVDLPGRVVYLSFPLDAVPFSGGVGNNRAGLLRNILDFLAPSETTSALTLDSDVYSVPGRAVVEVEDADLQGQGSTTITVQSPQQTNALTLTLFEMPRRGLFRGSVVFVPSETDTPGTVWVEADDVVQFTYFDASAGVTLTTTATIETNAPAIADVTIEPGYLEALVRWVTSEPADALVQYSEAPDGFPNNFTAYRGTLATEHELFLSGLKPNTTYYVRLASRDRAGNTTLDDNFGTNYTFTTRQPLLPPWFDDMEMPSLDWAVISPAESEAEWTRGAPGGGGTAYSGAACWGSNLGGGSLGLAESYLISPGILLTGGNRATLRFWHQYDFLPQSDFEIQLAAVFIITNIATEPVLLAQLPEDATDDWEEFTYDLTPYLGHVVYIAWYYFLFSMEDTPRLGWLVDDASLSVTTVTPGTVQITNNVWQAVFALSGPTSSLGYGRWTVFTNAPPGQYIVQFGDVPHFVTPPPQTNSLAAGGTLTFSGQYQFPDANANGIPDTWELQHFGSVDPQRTATTDTDADGLSDYAEFMAGTDPNNPPPPFALTAHPLPDGFVQLTWPSVSNHVYRVLGSTNFNTWLPCSDWLTAEGTNTTFKLAIPAPGTPHFFRVETAVPSGPSERAAVFRSSASQLASRQIQLDWTSAPGHGYRVLGSADLTNWTPVSDWIRATHYTTQLILPAPTDNTPLLFRIEAAP